MALEGCKVAKLAVPSGARPRSLDCFGLVNFDVNRSQQESLTRKVRRQAAERAIERKLELEKMEAYRTADREKYEREAAEREKITNFNESGLTLQINRSQSTRSCSYARF